MNHRRQFICQMVFLTILIPLAIIKTPDVSASSTLRTPTERQLSEPAFHPTPPFRLTPAQQYSGELLGYLLKVVLGRAGPLKSRDSWRVRAGDEPLDFNLIVKAMTDPDQNQLDFMVLDPDILGLNQVLFHYDETLSLYKGDYGVTSVYPAPEILAIRLFLLKKIDAGEKIDLDEFMRRETDLLNPEYQISPEDLAATRLSAREMKFLRDTFQSEPNFYRYLKYPFLLKAIGETDVLASGNLTEKIIRSADYTPLRCKPMGPKKNPGTVKIAFLPSMTKEFDHGKHHPSLSPYGFRATEFLEEIFIKLKTEIMNTTRERLERKLSKPPCPKLTEAQWEGLWHVLSQNDIAFYAEKERPLVIYPGNVSRIIREICPQADFTVILMGKNTYRAIYFDPERDVYPSVNRLYVDIMDIEYNLGGEEIETISRFICSRLQNRIDALINCTAEQEKGLFR